MDPGRRHERQTAATTAGIVLVGGRSTRMGRPKAELDWHGTPLVRHVVDTLGRSAGPVIVVRAPGQALPALPPEVRVVEDAREGRGPVEGLASGLRAAAGIAQVAFATGVDAPFLHPVFVRVVLDAIEGVDAVVPVDGGCPHPLAAAYRTDLAPRLGALLDGGVSSLVGVLDRCETRWLDRAALTADAALAAADPGLRSLVNLNDPGDYERARAVPPGLQSSGE